MAKTTKTEQTQTTDPQMARESHALLNLLRLVGGGYEPNRGVTKAAFTPKEEAAFDMGDAAASAFGMAPSGGSPMPTPTTSSTGVEGYRASDFFDDSIAGVSDGYNNIMNEFFRRFGIETDYEQYSPDSGGKK